MLRRMLFRLAVSGLTLLLGVAGSSLRHALGRLQGKLSENTISAQNVVRAPADKTAAGSIDPCDLVVDISVMGRYANFDYAYSVLVPEGMVGATSPAPNPNHGFGIDLTNPTTSAWTKGFPTSKAVLFIDGHYNSAELASLDDEVKWSLSILSEQHRHSRLLSKTATRLGGLQAVHFVAGYDEDGEAMIEDDIIAFRTEDGGDIVYCIDLRTPTSRYAQDKALVTQMQKSFLADPLPDHYPLPPVYEGHK